MHYLIKIFIGFSYGVSFPLTMIILDYWLKDHGISNTTIGLFSLLHLPFMFKFIWGMFIENYDVPLISKYFSRTKSWIFISGLCIVSKYECGAKYCSCFKKQK